MSSSDLVILPSNGDRSVLLLVTTWVWVSLAIIFVAMRFYCRTRLVRKVWWDDYMILAAVCFTTAMSGIWTIYTLAGGCRHQWSLTLSQIETTTRLNWISQPMCVGGLITGKISIAFLIYRLQSPTRWRTALLMALCPFMVLLNSICIILMFTQCRPVQLLWKHGPDRSAGHCIDHVVVVRINQCAASYMAFWNLALAGIAFHMIWRLQMHMRKKFAICCLLSTGVSAFGFAIVIVIELSNDRNYEDLTWATVMLFVWNAVDINLVIIAACIPTIVPLFELLTGRKRSSQFGKRTFSNSNSAGPAYGTNSFAMRDRPVRLEEDENTDAESGEGILLGKTVAVIVGGEESIEARGGGREGISWAELDEGVEDGVERVGRWKIAVTRQWSINIDGDSGHDT